MRRNEPVIDGRTKSTFRRIRWRRWICVALISVALVGAYDLAVLSTTTAKVLRHGSAFDWWYGPVSRSSIQIGTIPVDVYTGSRPRLQVLFVHGVNETGKDSADLRPVAEALAGSGFRVVVPDFSRMKRQNVTSRDTEDIVFLVRSLGVDTGILCASYGCGPALIAAASPQVRDRVRFIVTIGAYFDLKDTLRFIITSPPSSMAYSKWVYLAGNVDLVENEEDRRRLSDIAVERRDHPPAAWKIGVSSLGTEATTLLKLAESASPADFDRQLKEIPRLRDRIEQLSPSRHIRELRGELIALHLRSDLSIPSSESVRLVDAVLSNGNRASLTILDMYGHTRPQWPNLGIRTVFGFYLPEGRKFFSVLRRVLSYARS
jgi:pimeloyl-ACP methyl ester carboxylesterase